MRWLPYAAISRPGQQSSFLRKREAERFKAIDIEVRLEGRRGQLELAHCTDHRNRSPRRPRGCTPAELEALFPDLPAEATR